MKPDDYVGVNLSEMLDILLPIALLISTTFTVVLLSLPSRYKVSSEVSRIQTVTQNGTPQNSAVSVQVLVLGDIGRSPRMQYHAMSIAKHGGEVSMIGYDGMIENLLEAAAYISVSDVHPGLRSNSAVSIVPLSSPPQRLQSLQSAGVPFLVIGPLKVLWQVWNLFYVLGYKTEAARWLLVQNPPSIPTLFIAMIICFLRNTQLVIDWHNYGWTILASTKGSSHPFVRVSKAYECMLGRWAPTASFTVTQAMLRQLLRPPYSITSPILTLHDRPAEIFRPFHSPEQRADFLKRCPETAPYVNSIMAGDVQLVVSSTSWTPDEDFGLLLDALVSYSQSTRDDDSLPSVLALITGKGPQKQMYLDHVEKLEATGSLTNVIIRTAWLSMEDYALLLASADLGVCLHTSSSGVDLPMKVVDMFGAGLPVAGYSGYKSWPELVTEAVNGRGFESADELRCILVDLFGIGKAQLPVLRRGAMQEGSRRWDEEWDSVAAPVFGFKT